MKGEGGVLQIKRLTSKRWPVARAAAPVLFVMGLSLPRHLLPRSTYANFPQVLSRIRRAALLEAWNGMEVGCWGAGG